ncbi:MAG: hypothetical protein WC711_02190 [Candidatus Staskawiczbacteria bacterium]|jgi:hypothetical protein
MKTTEIPPPQLGIPVSKAAEKKMKVTMRRWTRTNVREMGNAFDPKKTASVRATPQELISFE